ncbi:MAG: leucine-rich repeat protein, partial [Bacteroidales bacterium]|nr:leucine-rich repeat protein [Bacteroidales bacterium]
MKKTISYLFTALCGVFLLASCQNLETDIHEPEAPVPQKELKEVIITASIADASSQTKTSYNEAEGKNYWSFGDKIKVFSAGEAAEFTSMNTEPETIVKFKGNIASVTGSSNDDEDSKDYVWGLYPYSPSVSYSEPDGISRTARMTLTYTDMQTGVAGTFGDNLAVMIGRSESLALPFRGAYSGAFFKVNRDDIVSMTLEGLNGEVLAGTATIGLNDNLLPEVYDVADPKTAVTVIAPDGTFEPGANYYMITLPDVALPNGYKVTLRRSDGYEGTYELRANRPLNRIKFRNLSTPIDVRIEDSQNIADGVSTGWVKPSAQSKPGVNEIWYKSVNGVVQFTPDGTTGNEVIGTGFALTNNGAMRRLLFSRPLTKIDANAFKGTNLTSIILPEGVTTIGEAAFMNCSDLTEIVIPDNVTTIEDDAFHYCTSLFSVTFGSGLKSIGNRAFFDIAADNIYIPDGVETIGDQAFAVCPDLRYVRLPESLTTIGSGVFEDSNYIEAFEGAFAADNRHLIDGDRLVAFAAGEIGDEYLEIVPDGVRVIDRGVYAGSTIAGVDLPDGLEEIGPSAFARCFNLKNITIPASVKRIYEWAFEECEGLDWVKIKRSESIIEAAVKEGSDWFAFDCTEDCPIYVPINALNWYTYGQHWEEFGNRLGEYNRFKAIPADNEFFYTTTDGTAVSLPAAYSSLTVIAPDDNGGVGIIRASSDWTTIPSGMFNSLDNPGTANLNSISIPDKVTTIEREAFFFCENLEDVSFGTGVTTIDHNAFFNCGLSTLVLPENIQLLRGSPFGANSSLTTVELPGQVEIFGGNPFMNCEGLIKFTGDHPYISEDGACLISPAGKLISYAGASTTDEFELPENVTELGDYAFAYASCAGIKINSLEPPTLGSHVFDGNNCYVSVPDATYSDYQAADGWSALASAGRLRYHQSVRSIWYTTTDGLKLDDPTALPTGCTLVRNVYVAGKGMMVFSDTVLDIPEEMIHNNQRLKTLSLPDKLEVIGRSAFSHCLYLESISLGSNLKEIGDLALYNTNSITTLTLPQSLKKIGKQALGATKLVSISIPESVTTFGDAPFYQSYQLESFTGDNPYISSDHHCLIVDGKLIAFTPAGVSGSYQVPSGVTSIGQYSMMRSAFTSLSFPASLQSIGISSLRYCESLKTVDIPESVTSIGAFGFSDCLSLESVKM